MSACRAWEAACDAAMTVPYARVVTSHPVHRWSPTRGTMVWSPTAAAWPSRGPASGGFWVGLGADLHLWGDAVADPF